MCWCDTSSMYKTFRSLDFAASSCLYALTVYCCVTIILNVFAMSSPLCGHGRFAIEYKRLWSALICVHMNTLLLTAINLLYRIKWMLMSSSSLSAIQYCCVMYIDVQSLTNSHYNSLLYLCIDSVQCTVVCPPHLHSVRRQASSFFTLIVHIHDMNMFTSGQKDAGWLSGVIRFRDVSYTITLQLLFILSLP